MTEKVMCAQCRLQFPEDENALYHTPHGMVCMECIVGTMSPLPAPTAPSRVWSSPWAESTDRQPVEPKPWARSLFAIPVEPVALVKAWAVQAHIQAPGVAAGHIAWGVFADSDHQAREVFLREAEDEGRMQGMTPHQLQRMRILITRVQRMPQWESFGMTTARIALMRAGGPKGKMGGAPKSL